MPSQVVGTEVGSFIEQDVPSTVIYVDAVVDNVIFALFTVTVDPPPPPPPPAGVAHCPSFLKNVVVDVPKSNVLPLAFNNCVDVPP